MSARTERSRPKGRSRWWRVHAWVGLKLSVLASFVFLSGTLAVIGHELDWAIDPAMRASPSAPAPASWGTIAANVATAVPQGTILTIQRGPDPWFATTAVVRGPDKRLHRVLVDPASGRVNRVAGFGSIQRFLRDLHRRLMLPLAIGIPIVTSISFVLMASLVTGLVTYKKWWRGFLKLPRGGGQRRWMGDMHRLLGLWSLWFVALMSLTGFWYLAELVAARAPDMAPVAADAAQVADVMPTGAALDAMVERARAAFPALDIRAVQYPSGYFAGVGFTGQERAWLVTDGGNAVWLSPDRAAPIAVMRGDQLSLHQRISEMADPLHFGTFGSLWTKAIWFLFGLALTGLSITGVIIYARRLSAEAALLATAQKGIGWWAYPSAALILLALGLSPWVLAG